MNHLISLTYVIAITACTLNNESSSKSSSSIINPTASSSSNISYSSSSIKSELQNPIAYAITTYNGSIIPKMIQADQVQILKNFPKFSSKSIKNTCNYWIISQFSGDNLTKYNSSFNLQKQVFYIQSISPDASKSCRRGLTVATHLFLYEDCQGVINEGIRIESNSITDTKMSCDEIQPSQFDTTYLN